MFKTRHPLLLALLTAAALGTSFSSHAESLNLSCNGGGTKALVYEWNPVSGAISYTFTLNNCRIYQGDGATFNGTIQGSGVMQVMSSKIAVNVTSTENLTASGTDTGTIACTRTLQGDLVGSNFAGSATMNNCTYSVQAAGFNLLETLSSVPFYE